MTTTQSPRITAPSATAALFETDAYKLGHVDQYRISGCVSRVYSNFTARGSRMPGVTHTVHFGLQAFLQRYCIEAFAPFFAADEDAIAAEYEATVAAILGPNTIGSEHIRALHRKGYLPLRFSAAPEGTLIPLRVPSVTIENTEPEFFWLTNYIETVFSAAVWHPGTTATIAHEYRKVLDAAAARTGAPAAAVDFQLHDFSYRGMSGTESAAANGAGHLLSSLGSDSLASIDFVNRYYPGDNGLLLGSVPATEHSVMCAGGHDDEFGTYDRLLDLYPSGIVSIVSDTWDFWGVVGGILPRLHDKIMGRDGKVVIRPDSGDPADILCGTSREFGEGRELAEKGLIEALWAEFGGTVNDAGYKELDPHIGAIYGDSITIARATDITERLAAKGFASTNVVFGVGSYSYQYQTRDTFMSALKATWVEVDGEGRDIQKNPVTDSGTKKSATGRLAVTRDDGGELVLIQRATAEQESASVLQPVWENGRFLRTQTFAEVRATLRAERASHGGA